MGICPYSPIFAYAQPSVQAITQQVPTNAEQDDYQGDRYILPPKVENIASGRNQEIKVQLQDLSPADARIQANELKGCLEHNDYTDVTRGQGNRRRDQRLRTL